MGSASTVSESKRRPSSSTSKTQSSRKIWARRSGALSPRARKSASLPCRTIALFRPQLEEQRTFQNEVVVVTGAAQPEENALEPVLDEDQSEIHVALVR